MVATPACVADRVHAFGALTLVDVASFAVLRASSDFFFQPVFEEFLRLVTWSSQFLAGQPLELLAALSSDMNDDVHARAACKRHRPRFSERAMKVTKKSIAAKRD